MQMPFRDVKLPMVDSLICSCLEQKKKNREVINVIYALS